MTKAPIREPYFTASIRLVIAFGQGRALAQYRKLDIQTVEQKNLLIFLIWIYVYLSRRVRIKLINYKF
ncbi:hypothetical protein CLV44_1165 [Marinobacterium halophilum]|uniref:Uncharacterized protein n=1 Tax=Marinobacterium halophilum TaxID=267374 RepID=A0A2P8ET35_9GAMM|nr:hypothetical protein CLV44_1165 [Marinobacterium halophilum]